MQKRFSASTAILIVLLLSVLYGVGRVVNPPTTGGHDDDAPAPDAKGKAVPSPSAKMEDPQEKMKRGLEKMRVDGEKKMAEAKAADKASGKPLPKNLPRTSAHNAPDGMDPALWQEHDMGAVAVKPDAKK